MTVHWPDVRVKPGFWLGPSGGLQPLPDLRGELSTQGYPRDWSVSIPAASPAEVAALYALAAHEVQFTTDLAGRRRAYISPTSPSGVGPLHWVTPYSQVTNLLPQRSVNGPFGWAGGNHSQGGPVALVDGMAGSSLQVVGTAYSPLFPVVPGRPVSVMAYVRARANSTAQLFLDWMPLGVPQDGLAPVTAASASTGSTTAPLPALRASATPPANAHVARLRVVNAAQVAMPAVTWTEGVPGRSAGQGCASVIVHDLQSTPTLARTGEAFEEVSFTVSEVG